MPRLARSGSRGLGTLGTAATVGAAGSTCTDVGAAGPLDVEPHRRELGILQQRRVDAGLVPTVTRSPGSPCGPAELSAPVGCSTATHTIEEIHQPWRVLPTSKTGLSW